MPIKVMQSCLYHERMESSAGSTAIDSTWANYLLTPSGPINAAVSSSILSLKQSCMTKPSSNGQCSALSEMLINDDEAFIG
jgi:hypothetical protein